jgi:tetratricopeptide (TPR) repeat protein
MKTRRLKNIARALAVSAALTLTPALASAQASAISSEVAGKVDSAVSAARGGDLNGAAATLAGLVDEPNGGYLAAYNLGVVRERQGKAAEAEQAYTKAIQTKPEFGPALRNLVRMHLSAGNVAKATNALNLVNAKIRADTLDHRVTELDIKLAKGQYEDVGVTARQILRIDEKHAGALLALSRAEYQAGRYELSGAVLKAVEKFHPELAETYYRKGLIALKFDKRGEAEKHFKAAIAKQGAYPEARNNLGLLFHQAKDHTGAIAQFEAAIAARPNYAEAYLNLGNAYKGEKRPQEAEVAFRKALSIDPNYADAHFNLGVLYLDSEVPGMETIPRLQKSIDELKEYKRMVKRPPKNDPVDKYVAEAKKAIETEKQRQELMREAPIE